jgi:hypothetical protein
LPIADVSCIFLNMKVRSASAANMVLVLTITLLAPGLVRAQDPSAPLPIAKPADQIPGSAAPTASATASTTQKPAKPKKVYTDEDFLSSPLDASASGRSDEVDISEINLCDEACFSRVLQGAVIGGKEYEHRRELILQAVENVKIDQDWQTTLHGFARYRVAWCTVEADKDAALRAHSDPRNVTREQLRIEDEYKRKEDALRSQYLTGLKTARLDERAAIGMGNLRFFELRFAEYQVSRISVAPCPIPRTEQQVNRDDGQDSEDH